MSDFNGVSPQGNWSLYVYDDRDGDGGVILNGWSLAVSSVSPVNQSADIGVSVLSQPSSVLVNDYVTNVFVITNGGPAAATGVTLSNLLPVTASWILAGASQGNWVTNNGALIANLFSLPVGGTILVTNVLQPGLGAVPPGLTNGVLTNLVYVAPYETDLHSANNHLMVTNNVMLPQTDLAVSLVGPTNTIIAGSNLTYAITVTNPGPGTAFSVLVTDPLPAGASFRSSLPSSVLSNNMVVFALGDLAAGTGANLVLTVAPGANGSITNAVSLTNTVTVSTASVDTAPGNNSAAFVVTVIPPAPSIVPAGAVLTAESLVRNDAVDPGETVTASLALANVGVVGTTNLVATLLATNGVIPVGGASVNYGALAPGGAAVSMAFTFTAGTPVNGLVTATLQLSDGARNLGAVSFPFTVSVPASFTTTNGITIPDHGIASPYPSVLPVSISGMTGIVSKATATLHGLTHSFPSDIDVLLVSPAGRNVLLMSHDGGAHGLTSVEFTFDDSAASSVSATNQISSGSYQPTTNAPASLAQFPAGPYGAHLAALNGADPNGTWSLYVRDDVAGDGGSIANWTLNLTVINPLNPLADLSVALTSSPSFLYVGSTLTYTITVTNLGPSAAANVVLTDVLPPG